MTSSSSSKLHSPDYTAEITGKLQLIRNTLAATGAAAIRLRGTDWFSWATAGANHTVLLAAEAGVAELLITANDAWLLTSEIEAQRFSDEELPGRTPYRLHDYAWAEPTALSAFVQEVTAGGKVLSDRPVYNSAEAALPVALLRQKQILLPSELERYRQVGRLASQAMTEVLSQAEPDWTEYQLAGAGAAALWQRGIHPALTLAAGERRLPIYRHPVPTQEPIGRIAMLVFCARGQGLYANLTRFVCFGSLSAAEADLHQQVRQIEAEALASCQLGTGLNVVYQKLTQAYAQQGQPQAIRAHHQGGTTGYLSREMIATPATAEPLAVNMAMAWNPSLAGAKIEDTFVLREDGLENLTADPDWPTAEIAGRFRPLPWER